jgi:hypothetical protein
MTDGRKWRSAGEQEDWLRAKGKLLAYVTEVLATRLRNAFRGVPGKAEQYVAGYCTPVAAEYVRRAIYRDQSLSEYEKAQLHLFTFRMYDFVISHYGGRLPDAAECIEELLNTEIPLPNAAFFTRMRRITVNFDDVFRAGIRRGITDDAIFAAAIVGHVMRIIKDESDTPLVISEEGHAQIQRLLENSGAAIHQLLAD